MRSWLSRLECKALSVCYGFTVPDYDGMMNAKKCQFLWRMVKQFRGHKGIILEIGSWQGCSTTWLGVSGQRFGFKQLIAIDLFTGTPSWELKGISTFEKFSNRMHLNGLEGFVKTVIGDSKEVIKTLKLPEGISILHIDGDHAYSAVVADINNYVPLLIQGGIVIVDDYDSLHPDVMRATNELMDSGKFTMIAKVQEISHEGYGSIALMKMEEPTSP